MAKKVNLANKAVPVLTADAVNLANLVS